MKKYLWKWVEKDNESKPKKTKYNYETSEFLPKKNIKHNYACNTKKNKNECLTHYTYRCFTLNFFFDQFYNYYYCNDMCLAKMKRNEIQAPFTRNGNIIFNIVS